MALSPFRLPRLISGVRLVDEQGRATIDFQRWWQEVVEKIESQEGSQDQLIADIQDLQTQQAEQLALLQATQVAANAAQQSANEAQSTADTAGGGTAQSGSATTTKNIFGTGWITGPTINLTSVAAGDLTIPGTGPTSGTLIDGTFVNAQYRIVELAGGTTIFTGSATINATGVVDNSVADVAAFSLPETTTGAVSYRLDVRRSGGTSGGTADISMYAFVRRS